MILFAERFGAAVQVLIGDGAIKHRLASAYSSHLADLAADDLPAALRPGFADLHAALNRVAPAGSESRIRASVQKMSVHEASGHAATIVKLYVELSSNLERAEPLKVVTAARQPPRYLTGRS